MKKILEYANVYVNRCNWKDMALLKICLCAVGIMVGLAIPEKKKKCSTVAAGIIFIVSYIPLMTKFVIIIIQENKIKIND